MIKNTFTLTILLLLSCETKPTDSKTIGEEKESLIISNSDDREDFNEFFKKFTTDSLFQIERVKFPWKMEMYIEDGIGVQQTSKQDWRFSTFYYETGYASRQKDAYTQEIKNYEDTVKLELRGVDNGIHIDYEFVTDKGKWMLISGKDYSD